MGLFKPKVYNTTQPDPSLAAMQRSAEQAKISELQKEVSMDTDNLIRAFGVRTPTITGVAAAPSSMGAWSSRG